MCERVSMNPNESYRCVPNGMGECKSTGDPHVVTFDGAQMDVYSTGKYVLAQSNDLLEDVPDFRVSIEIFYIPKILALFLRQLQFLIYVIYFRQD